MSAPLETATDAELEAFLIDCVRSKAWSTLEMCARRLVDLETSDQHAAGIVDLQMERVRRSRRQP